MSASKSFYGIAITLTAAVSAATAYFFYRKHQQEQSEEEQANQQAAASTTMKIDVGLANQRRFLELEQTAASSMESSDEEFQSKMTAYVQSVAQTVQNNLE